MSITNTAILLLASICFNNNEADAEVVYNSLNPQQKAEIDDISIDYSDHGRPSYLTMRRLAVDTVIALGGRITTESKEKTYLHLYGQTVAVSSVGKLTQQPPT